MTSSKGSGQKGSAARKSVSVKHTLADGTVKIYEYGPRSPGQSQDRKQPNEAPKWNTVTRTLVDGTVKTYNYPRQGTVAPQPDPKDSMRAIVTAYQHSLEWRELARNTQQLRTLSLRPLYDLGALSGSEVTRPILLKMRDAILEGSGPGAACNFVWAAQALFTWAVDRSLVPLSPAYKIKTPELGSIQAWTREEADFAERRLPPHLLRAVLLARYTGQRRGDLCKMLWSDYDGKTVRVMQQKTRKKTKNVTLVIKAHPSLRKYLDACPREASHILVNTIGRPWITPTNLSNTLAEALHAIGMPPELSLHGLRKLAAAELAEAGCSPHEISAVTGHRTLKEVERYTRSVNQEVLAGQAMDRWAERDAGRHAEHNTEGETHNAECEMQAKIR